MSKKYVINIFECAQMVEQIGVNDKGEAVVCSTLVENLEELNSDYINEHFGELQDTAYKKGFEDGKKEAESSEAIEQVKKDAFNKGMLFKEEKIHDAFQRGLDDAWEAARKIAGMWETIDNDDLLEIFGVTAKIGESVIGTLFKKQTANEAMLELKAYEEKQKADDKIEVGDEVMHKEYKNRFVVTKMQNGYVYGISKDGSWNNFRNDGSFVKTGRHFDIASILEDMRND